MHMVYTMLSALDLASKPEELYYEVRELQTLKFQRLRQTVRARISYEHMSALGAGDPGYYGYMHDRIFTKKKYKCFLTDDQFEQLFYINGDKQTTIDVLMTGYITSYKVFVCELIWRSFEEYADATLGPEH